MITLRRYWHGHQRWAEVLLDGEAVGFLRPRTMAGRSAYASLVTGDRGYATSGRSLRHALHTINANVRRASAVLDAMGVR